MAAVRGEPFFTVNDPENPLARFGRARVRQEFEMWEAIAPAEDADADVSTNVMAAALGVSSRFVEKRCESIEALRKLPQLRELHLELYHLDMHRLEGIWKALLPAKSDLYAQVDELLVEFLTPRTANQHLPGRDAIEARIKAILDELDPEISTKEKSTHDNAEVSTRVSADGRGDLLASYSAEVIAEIEMLIRQRARDAGISQAQALLDLLRGKAEVKVVLNLYAAKDVPAAPVYVPRAGWLDARASEVLRGRVDVEREVDRYFKEEGDSYQASAGLRAYLIGRDGTCRFPGCTVSADRCDVEHCLEYDKGGATAAYNCAMLCRHHHNMKTDGRFSYELDPETGEAVFTFVDGTVIATLPQGPISPAGARWVQTIGQRRGQRHKRARDEAVRQKRQEEELKKEGVSQFEEEPPF
ncbi:HNH endonuclease signature motif containing protein [Corynebacterium sp. A21]|uniref:HNH endonuclease signature motif containing protein n=1 Tax=Corynebacterium sp. A21 TaxID=3457318 RepID=UPI003FCF4254